MWFLLKFKYTGTKSIKKDQKAGKQTSPPRPCSRGETSGLRCAGRQLEPTLTQLFRGLWRGCASPQVPKGKRFGHGHHPIHSSPKIISVCYTNIHGFKHLQCGLFRPMAAVRIRSACLSSLHESKPKGIILQTGAELAGKGRHDAPPPAAESPQILQRRDWGASRWSSSSWQPRGFRSPGPLRKPSCSWSRSPAGLSSTLCPVPLPLWQRQVSQTFLS